MKILPAQLRMSLLFAGCLLPLLPPAHAAPAAGAHHVDLYSVQDLIGLHVVSSDGLPLGAISDFVFDFHGRPRLTDAIVTSGAFGRFGESRLVPVAALHPRKGHCQAGITWLAFYTLAWLPNDIGGYLAHPENLPAIDRAYGLPARPARGRFVTYSSLFHAPVTGSDGNEIGFLVDALVPLNPAQAFYLGVVPTSRRFDGQDGVRLEIPATAPIESDGRELRLSIPCDNRLVEAPESSDVPNLTRAATPLGRAYRFSGG